jgi:hypothetical protein
MSAIDSGRVTRTYTQRILAPPAAVFPLLCPVREKEWLEGWAEIVEVVHTESGVAEDGCVFRTRPPGRPETIWQVIRHDAGAGIVEFARVTDGLLATRLRIDVSPAGAGESAVTITYTFTPLNDAGRALVAESHGEESFRADMEWWQASMNHWLRTGEMLRHAAA